MIALVWAVLLPSVGKSMYFHRNLFGTNNSTDDNDKQVSKLTNGILFICIVQYIKQYTHMVYHKCI